MKKVIFKLAIMLLVAKVTFAAGFQGEVIKIEGNEIVIEIFDDQTANLKAGGHVSLDTIPQGVPTLDMLKG